jgi:hypothetical protein
VPAARRAYKSDGEFCFALDNQLQLLRQGVNHRDAYAVQTAGNFIGVIIEFTACVQDGHDHFRRGDALFRVNTGWDATAVIGDGDGVIAWMVTTMSLQ